MKKKSKTLEVYYKNGTSFNYYSQNGNRKVINNKEIDFNKDISFGAYIK